MLCYEIQLNIRNNLGKMTDGYVRTLRVGSFDLWSLSKGRQNERTTIWSLKGSQI